MRLSGLPRCSEHLMKILCARALDEYVLELTYADGSIRLFDAKPLLELSPWRALRSKTRFAQVRADFNTVTWPGEIDIAPETLWLDSVLRDRVPV